MKNTVIITRVLTIQREAQKGRTTINQLPLASFTNKRAALWDSIFKLIIICKAEK